MEENNIGVIFIEDMKKKKIVPIWLIVLGIVNLPSLLVYCAIFIKELGDVNGFVSLITIVLSNIFPILLCLLTCIQVFYIVSAD